MQTTQAHTDYLHGLRAQREALTELMSHADRLMAGLSWISEDTAEAYALLAQAAAGSEVELLLAS